MPVVLLMGPGSQCRNGAMLPVDRASKEKRFLLQIQKNK